MKQIGMKNFNNVCLVSLIAFVVSVATIALVVPVKFMRTHAASTLNSKRSTDSKDSITVHAAGRGNPWINLSDGRNLASSYTGAPELQRVLEQNLASPLSLTSADFDDDGVPDLISGYAGPGGGIITLHLGNVDSIYHNAPEAQQRKANGTYTDSPFLSPAHVFEVPEPTDFVGAGDFDADSHWDVVAAARGGNALWLLSGDGQGGFGAARRIDLAGRVTTLVTGEINRADGLTDVVVGVVGADGPKALVFESPDGALRGKPEAYGLPAEATAMAIGRLDGDYTLDLAVGAGNDLIVVYGRDRKLSLDEIRQAEVPIPEIGQRSFAFAIKSAAIGDLTGDHRTGLSLLSNDGAVYLLSGGKAISEKNNSSDRVENWKSELLARGPWQRVTHLVCARVSSIPGDNLVVVDSANHKLHVILGSTDPRKQASGARFVSLDVEGEPMAVLPMRLNGDAFSDLVILGSAESAPVVMMTQPMAIFTVTNTSDSGPGSLRQAMTDAKDNPGADTIVFSIGSGIQTITSTNLPIIEDPVTIDATTQPGFGGSPLIELHGIGTIGLDIRAGPSTIKGLVINRFTDIAIIIEVAGNVIEGNYIGTDISGTATVGNTFDGLFVTGATNNTIGGTSASARNVISGTILEAIEFRNGATGNVVQGNYIGTDVTGAAVLGNSGDGVVLNGASNNTIGGTVAGARNVLSGNGSEIFGGVTIKIAGQGNLVQGNYVGTDVTGTAELGNFDVGVSITNFGVNNTIGGTTAGARNVISSNAFGIGIGGSSVTGNLVQGNYIGTDVTGTADLGNSGHGVSVTSPNTTIGGTAVGARNVISGNNTDGIVVRGATTGSLVQGNYIGTDVNGTAALGNFQNGIRIVSGQSTVIGGSNIGELNIIAFNGANGVFVVEDIFGNLALNNAILSNSIHSNMGLGIDLAPDGVTANDACDADTGSNNLQNFPVLTSASTTSIQGTLNSTANTTFTIQFFANSACDTSGNGEGQTFIGSMAVTTDAGCNASFTFAAALSQGQIITATATDPSNNTSEFSQCKTVTSEQQTFIVTNTNNSGLDSLRQAILDSNATVGQNDTITFNIAGSGVRTISPSTALPTITDPVTIDGTTQPGFSGSQLIELNGGNAGPNVTGLNVTAGNSLIKGLIINRFAGYGIVFQSGGGNVLEACFIGIDSAGTAALANGFDGVAIFQSNNNRIGGLTAAQRNVISGNSRVGVIILNASGNVVLGNYVGTNASGSLAVANANHGVLVQATSGNSATNNTVGGMAAGAGNVISGNALSGVAIDGGNATGNMVQGNSIGTDLTGTAALGNGNSGLTITAPGNTIGGTTGQARNVISGNIFDGVRILGSAAAGNQLQGNYIGTDVTGAVDLGNLGDGVFILASGNMIGGTTPGLGNVISGNRDGVLIAGGTGNLVQGNFIGINSMGTAVLGNSIDGVFIGNPGASGNVIGGTTIGAQNVISGNGQMGIRISLGAADNQVQGNLIGTDFNGTFDLGNTSGGVLIVSAPRNIVGGTTAGGRNVISGNSGDGIAIFNSPPTDTRTIENLVQGNFIGTQINGLSALGNSSRGIFIRNSASNNSIGGTASGAGNTIAFNGGGGVFVESGVNNTILSNSIHSNTGLGIDLGLDGVTANDACDPDTGANNFQNFPVLTSASTTSIQGTLNSTANTTFTIQFFANISCDPSGNGEGQTFIGSMMVTTNGSCNASFTFPAALSQGELITATATDPTNNTSEFSQCLQVTCVNSISPASQFFTLSGGPGSVNVMASSTCNWAVTTNDSWITITSGDIGSGSDTVTFEVRENFTASARQGAIKISSLTFTVVQDGGLGDDCDYSVSPLFQSFPASEGNGTVNVTASERCAWQATSNVSWVIVTSGNVGIGDGMVTYLVLGNPSSTGRKGIITIAGKTFAVKQKGG